jgi:hypothetical protein
MLFERAGHGTGGPIRCGWDVSPDGQRFLITKGKEVKTQPVTELILVQYWLEELKRLVPPGKN